MKHLPMLLQKKEKIEMTFLLVLCILFLLPVFADAQETSDADPELPGIQQIMATVKIDGKDLFNVRGISSYTAEERASGISKRIKEAASDRSVPPDSVKIVSGTNFSSIYAGKRFIMNVYDADSEVEQVRRETLAGVFRQRITETIELYRYNRSRTVLVKKIFVALGSMVALVVLLFIIGWLFRRIDKGIQNRIKARIDILENKSFSLIQANQLWKTYHMAFKILRIIALVLVFAAFINYLLSLFPWTSSVAAYVLKLFIDPLLSIGRGFLNFLPDLAFLIVIYIVARYFLKISKLLFNGIQEGGIIINGFDPDWAVPTFRIFRILVIAFSVIIAYPYIPGSESSAFKGVSVFIGVLFSLGSSSFISNLIAGYSMTYRRAFKKGDRIMVGDQIGFIEEQEILVTRMRSIKNEEIVIPNSVLLNSNIINFSTKAREGRLIIHTTVGIGYETPWRMVDSMLKLAAGRTEGLLEDPPPFVLKLSLGDFAVTYEINAFCNDASRMPQLYSALHQNILDVFNENNVQIMTPAYEGDPEIPKVVPRNQWDTPLANENEI
jgi:small-conductance mechanosensitive channel